MTQVDMIKNELSEHIGKHVIVKANRGRKRIVTRKGILKAVYPSLFVVTISSEEELCAPLQKSMWAFGFA